MKGIGVSYFFAASNSFTFPITAKERLNDFLAEYKRRIAGV